MVNQVRTDLALGEGRSKQTKPTFAQARDYAALLRAHGIHPTAQRVEIASVLLAARQHCSADEILCRVNGAAPRVSKATVYNTLRLFAARGLVREVLADPTKVFFDSNTEPHHHFYDVDSGELTDVDEAQLQWASLPEVPQGTELVDVDVVIRVRSKRS